jgi:hypothetical protein
MKILIFYLTPLSIILGSIVSESINFPPDQSKVPIAIEGIYEERVIPYLSRYPDGTEAQNSKTIITFTPNNAPILGNSTITIENKIISQNQKTLPFFLVGQFRRYDEFSSLLGKEVFIDGYLEPSNDLFFFNTPQIHLNYAVESKWRNEACQELSYEPTEVTLEGKISTLFCQDSISIVTYILVLDKPIHIIKNVDNINEPEMYVTEIQLFFPNNFSFPTFDDKNVSLTGKLSHADSYSDHRRILCDVRSLIQAN